MTNTINSVTLAIVWLVATTNWTGHHVGTNELGYVATNHVLKCEYQGVKYDFTLKTEPGTVAVWRPEERNYFITNFWWPRTSNYFTNLSINAANITNRYTLEATNRLKGKP